jgi:ABC-type glycerol-3-phosphate transport system substrate-binding protein
LAASLLQARLNEFAAQHPGLKIEVRIKALDGLGGLLNALSTTAAAPLALPDLIALPRPLLETAALKGLLHPYDGLTNVLDASDWYEYAHQLALLENSAFGLPFAGDALLLVYRPSVIGEPPHDWQELLKTGGPLAFPAADPQAIFPLTLYQTAGGPTQDTQNRPMLDLAILTQVLTFTLNAGQSGVIPNWLTLYETYDQTWEIYGQQKTSMAVAWASRYLSAPADDSTAALLPTPGGTPFTLANGWVWALASPRLEQQKLAVKLAEFLVDGSFLEEWCKAAGYLPPRSSALAGWSDTSQRSLVSQIAISAQLYPPADVLSSLGSPLAEAVLRVVKLQTDPATAAQDAVNSLNRP